MTRKIDSDDSVPFSRFEDAVQAVQEHWETKWETKREQARWLPSQWAEDLVKEMKPVWQDSSQSTAARHRAYEDLEKGAEAPCIFDQFFVSRI